VPSLRQRKEDIPMLAKRFVKLDNARYNRAVRKISSGCVAALLAYPWPGNVRELRAKISFAVATCEGEKLLPEHVFPDERRPAPGPQDDDLSLASIVRAHIASVLAMTDWNIARSARLLGISRPTLRGRIEKYGLERPGERF
jgi:DNA-binding NtrC family response regulator